jgi:hypothetical protein
MNTYEVPYVISVSVHVLSDFFSLLRGRLGRTEIRGDTNKWQQWVRPHWGCFSQDHPNMSPQRGQALLDSCVFFSRGSRTVWCPQAEGKLEPDVAAHSLAEVLIRHGSFEGYELFRMPVGAHNLPFGVAKEDAPDSPRKNVRVHDYRDLFDRTRDFHFSVWHDPAGLFILPVDIRASLHGPFLPVTATLHSLNYH